MIELVQRRLEGGTVMCGSERWTVKCQGTADGSGDVIVELPLELLAKMGLALGDDLDVEILNDAIILKPKRLIDALRDNP